MSDTQIIDILARIRLPAILRSKGKMSKNIKMLDNADLELKLEESNIAEQPPDDAMLFPSVKIMLKGRAFRREELTVKNGMLPIHKGEPSHCNWYKSAQDIANIYNLLIGEFFRIYPHEFWQRIGVTYFCAFNLTNIEMLQSNFPDCLDFWHVQFRKQSSDKWIRCFVEAERDSSMFPNVDFNQTQNNVITSKLEASYRSKRRLSIGWEYLFQASQHFVSYELRNAVIDLDIATDFVAREHIKTKAAISSKYMDKLLNKSSTGDLLDIAQALVTEESEATRWAVLKELHSIRSTVLHRYQRQFSNRQIDTILSARINLISILRDLDTTS